MPKIVLIAFNTILFIASGTVIMGGAGASWPLAALPKIRSGQAGLDLTSDQISWMVTILYLGILSSPIPSGYVMNYIGRRNALMAINIFAITAWTLVYATRSEWGLCLARFMLGCWGGGTLTIAPIYIAESLDPEIRAPAVAFMGVFHYAGVLLESGVGPTASYAQLAIINGGFPLAFTGLLFLIPESPYYFLMKGRQEDAKRSLMKTKGNVADLPRMEAAVEEQMKNRKGFVEVLSKRENRKAFMIIQLLRAVQRSAGQVILTSYASITIPQTFVTPEKGCMMLGITWLIFSIIGTRTVETFGRRAMIIFSCSGICVTMSSVSTWFFLRDKTDVDVSPTTWMPLVILMFHGAFFAVALVSIPSVLQSEIFPVNIKAKASALTVIFAALVSATVVRIYFPVWIYVGLYANFLICAISGFGGALFGIFIMFETKGKTLEDIQNILTS